MIREREGSKGIRLFIAFFFIAIFFFIIGFIADKLFFAKDAAKTLLPLSEKEAALGKADSDRKGNDAKKKNPIVGEEKEDLTFYKTLQNGKEPSPLKQQKTEEKAQKKEEKEQKAENRDQNKEEKKQKTAEKSQKTEKADNKEEKKQKEKPKAEAKNKTAKKEKVKGDDSSKEKRFTLQIAAFKEKDKAEDVAGSLKKKGYEPYIVPVTIPAKGVWYRVRIGRFSTRPDAQNIQARLKNSEGISSFITFTTE